MTFIQRRPLEQAVPKLKGQMTADQHNQHNIEGAKRLNILNRRVLREAQGVTCLDMGVRGRPLVNP